MTNLAVPPAALKFTGGQAVVALAVVVLAAFLPIRENGFVSLDDKQNLLENASFRGLGRPQLVWAWTTGHLGVYEPLGWMFLEAEYEAWGLDPRGYHLASLALYSLVTVALYGLTVAVVARSRPGLWRDDAGMVRACACLAVGLYAVHPLRVQVVAWASCQSYVACGLFSVLTVLAYLRAHDAPPRVRRRWLVGCLLFYAASLLSKAPATTLPAVLLILDVYPLGRLGPARWLGPDARRVYREKVPFAALSVVFAALAVWARARAMIPFQLPGQGVEGRVARACYNVVFYLVKTVVPIRISACYPVPSRMALTEPRFLLSAAGVAAVSVIVAAARRRFPGALAAWVVYLVMLAPSAGLFRTGGPYVAADRYCFMPMMGLAVLAASVLCAVAGGGRAPRAVALGVFVAVSGVVLALAARTRDECRTWRDSETLWSRAIAVSTEPNPFACHGLALVLAGEPGRLARAESLLDEAFRTVTDDPSLHNALTTVLAKQGRTVEALVHARAALRLDPDNVPARVNLGNLLALKGDPSGAEAAYEAALRIDPNDADAHNNLGLILSVEGRTAEAEAHLSEALRHNPMLSHAKRTLDALRRRQDRTGVPPDQARGSGL